MQTLEQKQLQLLIQTTLNDPFQNLMVHTQQITKLLSSRVDMPKHLINDLSKKFATKDLKRIQKIFDILLIVSHQFQNNIALFNQISGNKQFLFKITSILSMKNLTQNIKIKIVDLIYNWKQLFKPNKQLFPNYWHFYQNFQKKGFTPSNLNFQTRYQKNICLVPSNNQVIKQQLNKNIFDLIGDSPESLDFSKIQNQAISLFYNVFLKIVQQNKIISNTSPQILDFPPVLKQKMGQLKICQDRINKFIAEHKNQVTIDTATSLIKSIHLTEKRYTELITRYLPQKFALNDVLIKFQSYCNKNQQSIKQNQQALIKDLDLLDLGTSNKQIPINNGELLDLQIPSDSSNQGQNAKKGISNFFGNLLNNVNAPKSQISLSNQPIQTDFRTDLDFVVYQDPKTLKEHYDYIKNLKADDFLRK